MTDKIVIFITCANKKEALRITHSLLKNRVAACVNILDKITSLFWWQGRIDSANEVLLIVKSKKEKLPKIIKLVKSLHSYKVPEIIALAIIAGNKDYLRWIDGSCR